MKRMNVLKLSDVEVKEK